ncbi:MAG: Crp/Fnr family transcriptional regulator [Gammaproteobacteria bacterium]
MNSAIDCESCHARTSGLCAGHNHDALQAISGYRTCDRHLKAGQDLFRLGEPCDAIYNLVDGWIFPYSLLADGRRQILDFALPGAVLGFDTVAETSMSYGAQALTDAVVCVIPKKALEPLSRRHPEVALRLASMISQDRNLSFAHLTSIGRQSARERVAHLILELFVRFRSRWPGHRVEEMHLPLTQEHIGDATGLTGVHVNRVLHDLRQDGVLTFSYRRLSILDPDRLVDEAGIDPEVLRAWVRQGVAKRGSTDQINAARTGGQRLAAQAAAGRARTGARLTLAAYCQA